MHIQQVSLGSVTISSNLDSRLGQLEEQGKTMAEATRRPLDTVNVVKETRVKLGGKEKPLEI